MLSLNTLLSIYQLRTSWREPANRKYIPMPLSAALSEPETYGTLSSTRGMATDKFPADRRPIFQLGRRSCDAARRGRANWRERRHNRKGHTSLDDLIAQEGDLNNTWWFLIFRRPSLGKSDARCRLERNARAVRWLFHKCGGL
jgi:hypothetical protein